MILGYITPEYPSTYFKGTYGGIGTFTKGLATQLVKANHKVFVFIHSQKTSKIVEENGVILHFIEQKYLKGFTWWWNRKHCNHYINEVVKQEGIQILEAPEWTGFTAFMKFNCPLLLRLHGSDTYFCHLEGRSVKFKNKLFEKIALKEANFIVGVSQFVAHKTKRLFKIRKHITIVYNAIDTSEFIPNHENIQTNSILYFGSIIRKKGVLELAKAFNLVIEKRSNTNLLLVGKDAIDVITKTSTIQLFYDLLSPLSRASVSHLNEVPYNEIRSYIHKANVVVLPSFAEAFPMTWLETLALEKPLVSSNIGWANELMVNNSTGYTVDPKNHKELALKIIELLENPKLCEAFGKEGRLRVVENFSAQKITNQNIEFYKECINK